MMKISIISLLALALMVSVAGTAQAVPLPSGSFVVPTGAASPGGALIDSMTATFVGTFGRIGATVTENVLSNATGLLFEYIITSTSTGTITQASASFFNGFLTGVDAPVAPYTPNVDIMTRGADGETVTWGYIGDAIRLGESSGVLWVQTNATSYSVGQFALIGADTATMKMFAPNANPVVPEPATMSLIGLGLLGFVGKLRKKFTA